MATMRSRTLSVTIERAWGEVYAFASDPTNMAQWAPGLGGDFRRVGAAWELQGPDGTPIMMRFAEPNPYGVLDHDVTSGGETVHIAMRVTPNGDGAELTFLLLQTPGMSDAAFERDAVTVLKDLMALKAIMER